MPNNPQKGVSLFDAQGIGMSFLPVGFNFHMPVVDTSSGIAGTPAPSTTSMIAGLDYTNQIIRSLSVTPTGVLVTIGEDEESAQNTKTFSANTGSALVSVAGRVQTPILSITPNSGSTTINFLLRNLMVEGNGSRLFYQLIYNGALTGAHFTSVNVNSSVSYDTSATAITGGQVVDSGYFQLGPFFPSYQLHFGFTSSVADILTLVITPMGSLAVPVSASFRWTERASF